MALARVVCYDADFYPFGGERTVTDSCSQNYKLTEKERDGETGNAYCGVCFYTSSFGLPDAFMVPRVWDAAVSAQ